MAPYLALCREDAQRDYPLQEVFNDLRSIMKTTNQWRLMPHDLPSCPAAYQQMQRWMNVRYFKVMAEERRRIVAPVEILHPCKYDYNG